MIAKHLQLKGEVDSDNWHLPIGTSFRAKTVIQQLDHWCTMLARKREGRRLLARMGYTFTIRLLVSTKARVVLPPDSIESLVRQGLGLEIVYSSAH